MLEIAKMDGRAQYMNQDFKKTEKLWKLLSKMDNESLQKDTELQLLAKENDRKYILQNIDKLTYEQLTICSYFQEREFVLQATAHNEEYFQFEK